MRYLIKYDRGIGLSRFWTSAIAIWLVAFICFSVTTVQTYAQSIDELLQIAATENPGLKVLEKEYLAALEKAPQVSQLPDPELGVGVFPLPVETRLGSQIIRVGGTQMLPWPGTLNGKADLETTKAKAMQERIAMQQIEVFYDLKKAWLKLYEIEKSQAVIRRNTQLLEALEQLALAKVESGKGTASDVLRVQLKTNELQQQLDILEVAKTAPKATINQLLNRGLNTPISIQDSLAVATLPFDKTTFSANISQNHPLLKMLGWQQQVSRQSLEVNKLDSKLSFGVGLDYIMVNERTDAEPAHNGRDIVQLRGTVKIPLNKTRFEAREQEENLKIEAIEWQKEDALNRFNAMIERAYAGHETARLQVEFYKKQKTITEAAIRILESEYSAKGSRFDELLLLEKDLVEYDFKILKAVVESHLAKAELERFVF